MPSLAPVARSAKRDIGKYIWIVVNITNLGTKIAIIIMPSGRVPVLTSDARHDILRNLML